jgi:Uma2 family endonuclease
MAIRKPKPPLVPGSQYHGRRMSEAEYLALSEEPPYLEYVDGVVLQKPMPNADHRKLIRELIILIGLYGRAHGGDSGPEGRVRLPDGSGYRLPDTAYWAPGVESGDDSVPTLAIEVRSPGQPLATLREKCRAFRRNGVGVCWLFDPATRSVEVFEGSKDGARFEGESLTSDALPGFELNLPQLFAVLDN